MFIGEISKNTNIPVKTIRYYEEFGLLHKPKRSMSQYRVYSLKDIEKLLFIKKSKDLGLTLAEIKKIIKRSSRGVEQTCCLVHEVFEEKITDCEQRIKALKETKKRLSERLHHWITPGEAKKLKFTICPQIETEERKKKRSSAK
ncbi:MAG: MerR family transcriptional regulator [Candidatus Omnitrophica bacterium]|nr:MerR family transcriptional regulator [Candidatus Omnitrophota bacterium]